MAFDPCESCGAKWYLSHRTNCQKAADKFLADLAKDKRATSDDFPRCPKCGQGDDCWTDSVPRHVVVGDGSEWKITCQHCEHDYSITLWLTYHFRVEQSPAASLPESPEAT
jgi:hypothetical protein